MSDPTFIIGVLGGATLVAGAAYPVQKVSHPVKSRKNWLFAVGGAIMLLYSLLNYQTGGPIFFIFLQILVNISSVMMMLNTSDKIDTPIIVLAGLVLIVWSLRLFEGYNTVFFIIGLSGIGLGYAFEMGTMRRGIALTIGSTLIALFSYVEASWIFFWLNIFFALFSGYYLWKQVSDQKPKKQPK
ncbi:MAG: hypothetical protein O2904_03500 [bacterium]|nr:hypothetical protein [bacterium]